MKIRLIHKFEDIISLENLLSAWQEFLRGKRSRLDVQKFSFNLMDNVFSLHHDLLYQNYKHGGYEAFKINDPKPRDIHKASVRDRLLHHAVYRILYPFFAKTFIADSYSCQVDKGAHKALNKFRQFSYKSSKNNTQTCYVLKGDIRKFFASIDHDILLEILNEYIPDKNIIWLLEKIISSFSSTRNGIGLPLGNLTSQLFVNIYMNKFDQFVKHKLKNKQSLPPPLTPPLAGGEFLFNQFVECELITKRHCLLCHSREGGNPVQAQESWIPAFAGMTRKKVDYIRYADDFVIFSDSKEWLVGVIPVIKNFLSVELKLELHPDKLFIKTIASGVDFLGWVNFPDHRVLRTKTKRRMMNRAGQGDNPASIASYLGLLNYGNAFKIRKKLLDSLL